MMRERLDFWLSNAEPPDDKIRDYSVVIFDVIPASVRDWLSPMLCSLRNTQLRALACIDGYILGGVRDCFLAIAAHFGDSTLFSQG